MIKVIIFRLQDFLKTHEQYVYLDKFQIPQLIIMYSFGESVILFIQISGGS